MTGHGSLPDNHAAKSSFEEGDRDGVSAPDLCPLETTLIPSVPCTAPQTAEQVFHVPASAVAAYNNGRMPPDVRAELDADLKIGRAQLPAGATLLDPDAVPPSDLMRKLGLTARDVMDGIGKKLGIEPESTVETSAEHSDGCSGYTNFCIPLISPKVTLRPLTDTRTQRGGTLFQRAQQYQEMLWKALRNPTAANFSVIAETFADRHANVSKGWNGVRTEQQQSELENAAREFVALASNKSELAIAIVQEHLTALQAGGDDLSNPAYVQQVRDVQGMIDLIRTDPRAAQGLLGATLSSAMSVEEFSKRFSPHAAAPATIGSMDQVTATISAQRRYTRQRSRRRNPAWRTPTRNLCR